MTTVVCLVHGVPEFRTDIEIPDKGHNDLFWHFGRVELAWVRVRNIPRDSYGHRIGYDGQGPGLRLYIHVKSRLHLSLFSYTVSKNGRITSLQR